MDSNYYILLKRRSINLGFTYFCVNNRMMNYFEKANNYYSKKDYINAINFYKKSIEIKQNEAAALYNSAVCLIKLKAFEKAIESLRKAIHLKPDSRYFFNLGYCYAMLSINSKALIYFNTAWALDNEDTDCEKAVNKIITHLKR